MTEKILIVDDEPEIRDLVEAILTTHKFTCFQAANGKEGLEMAKKIQPNLILSDIRMPVIDGLQFLKNLRENEIFINVILMSGFADKEAVREAWKSGAFDLLDKPFSQKRLIDSVEKAIRFGSQFTAYRISKSSEKGPVTPITLHFGKEEFHLLIDYCKENTTSVASYILECLDNAIKKQSRK